MCILFCCSQDNPKKQTQKQPNNQPNQTAQAMKGGHQRKAEQEEEGQGEEEEEEEGEEEEEDEAFVRRNGWTRPLNKQQIGAWIVLAVMALFHFGLVAPSFPERWQATPYFTVGGCFLAAAFLLFICTTIDPRDANVRYDIRRPVTIDRSRRKHVIMNSRCHFCRVQVSSRAKHCSACNKCVGDFDHHCLWMNNCVGGRTYRCGNPLTSV